MNFREKIREIEDASGKLLVPKQTSDHAVRELFGDLLAKTTTLEEVEECEALYRKHFDGDEILEMIHKAKVEKGFARE